MQKQCVLLAICLAALCLGTAAKAQYQNSKTQNKAAIEAALKSENLHALPGLPATYYSTGAAVRARALQNLLGNCAAYYQKQFHSRPFMVRVFVLNKADWEKPPLHIPYGLPDYLDDNRLIVIGADKNALARLSGMPDDPQKSDSIVSTYDYVAVHELGHYFFITLNHVSAEAWFDEFLADYFLVNYIEETGHAKDVMIVARHLMSHPPHRSLHDFDTLYDGVGVPNYDWYQKKFLQIGFSLHPVLGKRLIHDVLTTYPAKPKRSAVAFLQRLAPRQMDAWLSTMH